MTRIRTGLSAVAASVLFAAVAPAQFTPVKVIATGESTSVGTFTQFPAAPSIRGNTVAFPAATATGQGIFTVTGTTFASVATTATAIPGGSGNFTVFAPFPVGLSANGVAFGGQGFPAPGNAGNYTTVFGTLTTVVNNLTPFPVGGNFNSFSIPSLSGTVAAFAGGPVPMTSVGVFTRDGIAALTTVANTSTAVPFGSGNFTAFVDPANGGTIPQISGGTVVFNGQGGGRIGLYSAAGGIVSRVADNFVSAPGGTGNFSSFGITPAVSGSDVAFYAASPGRTGIYLSSSGILSRVADTTVQVPGEVAGVNFSTFFPPPIPSGVAVNGGRVVFVGTTTNGKTGVYSAFGGTIQKVVATGDIVDGRTISTVAISDFAYDGGDTAVLVTYAGGAAVYRFVPVPEPAAVLTVAAGFLFVGRTIRGRFRKPPEPQ